MKWHLRWMTFTFGLWLACAAPGARAERSLAIVFTNDARLGTLSNFPALVELSTSISNFSYGDFLSTDGYDLRFWSDDAKTEELDYEIERWDTNALAAAFSPTRASCKTPRNAAPDGLRRGAFCKVKRPAAHCGQA